MKLCTRISSIRRIAWNACRSCSPASCSMWPDSLRSHADAGCSRLAVLREHLGDRVLRQPVDLQLRPARAQLGRDRDVPLRVPEPDRRREVQRAFGGRRAARTQVVRGAGAANRSTNCAIRWLIFTGSRADGPCPACSSRTSSPPVSSASRSPNACGRMRSSVPCTTTTGHVTWRASGAIGSHTAPSHPSRPAVVSARVSRRDLVRPADAVLDLLGRVRLGEHLAGRRTR